MVGFNAVLTSEHFGAFLAFGVLHAALAIDYIKVRRRRRPPLGRGGAAAGTAMAESCMRSH